MLHGTGDLLDRPHVARTPAAVHAESVKLVWTGRPERSEREPLEAAPPHADAIDGPVRAVEGALAVHAVDLRVLRLCRGWRGAGAQRGVGPLLAAATAPASSFGVGDAARPATRSRASWAVPATPGRPTRSRATIMSSCRAHGAAQPLGGGVVTRPLVCALAVCRSASAD
jgi:hypothetical protein